MTDEIHMVPVTSSNVDSVGYDSEASRLVVKFKSGTRYAYDSVPPEIHLALMAAPRAGKYFHANIRDKYPTTKLEG